MRFWVFTLVLIISGLLTGCNLTTEEERTDNSEMEVVDYSEPEGTVVWASGPITHTGLRKELIEKFEEKYPNVEVRLQEMSPDTNIARSFYTTTIGGRNTTPDIYNGDTNWPAQFGNASLAMDLSKVMPAEFWERFSSELVDSVTFEGGKYGAPLYTDIGYLYYRKDILEKEGIPVPQTWEEVKEASIELTKRGAVDYGFVWQGASYEGLTTNFLEYLNAANGRVFGKDGEVEINSEAANKALVFMQDLIQSGASPKAVTTFREADAMNTFNAGSAAFLRNWAYAWGASQDPENSKVVGRVGVAKIPSFASGERHTTQAGWNVFVNPHTQNLPATLAFLDFLTGEEAQTLMADKYSMLPTNVKVQNNKELIKKNQLLGLFNEVVKNPRPVSANYGPVSEALYTNVNDVISGNSHIKKILEQMEERIESADRSGL